ncbi:MAG: lipopolysaccharide biosynthesis protein [Isosphaeraceae bacterium]
MPPTHVAASSDHGAAAGVPEPIAGRPALRGLVRGMGLYSAAALAQRVVGVLMLPVYTRFLTRADYGVIELLELVWNVAAMFVSLQLSSALFYFYHHAEGEDERRRHVVSAFVGCLLMAGFTLALIPTLAPAVSRAVFKGPNYASLIAVSLAGLAFSLPAEFGLAYLRLQDRAGEYVVVTLLRLAANVAFNVTFLAVAGMGAASMPCSSLISTVAIGVYALWLILPENSLVCFDGATLVKMAGFGLPLGLCTAGEFILHFGDRFFLSRYVSLGDLGLYGLAYRLGMVVTFAAVPFFSYWHAQMVGIVKKPGGEAVYSRMATYYLLGLSLLTLGLVVFVRPALSILVGPGFEGADRLVVWVALAYAVRTMGMFWNSTFILERRTAIAAEVTWYGAIACLLGYMTLIPRFGIWGALAATHLGLALMSGLSLWRGQRLRRFDYEYGRWLQIVCCAVAAGLPAVVWRPSGFVPQLALGGVCVLTFFALLWVTRFATAPELRFLSQVYWTYCRTAAKPPELAAVSKGDAAAE